MVRTSRLFSVIIRVVSRISFVLYSMETSSAIRSGA
jgi:hypothetical protein